MDSQELDGLSAVEQVVLAAWLCREMSRARSEARKVARVEALGLQILGAVTMAAGALAELNGSWARALEAELDQTDLELRASVLAEAASALTEHVEGRRRSLVVLVSLVSVLLAGGLRVGAVNSSARDMAFALPGVEATDADLVVRTYGELRRRLARTEIKWGRTAVLSAVGVGLGVVTFGAAAPAIGAFVGGTILAGGLTGAAATSAGLAALGGGSLAAGGFGVAGGTALLTGIGGASGLGLGLLGARLTGWGSGVVTADALRLAVLAQILLREDETDDQLARRVVVTLRARLDRLAKTIEVLGARLAEVNAENRRLSEENEWLQAALADARRAARTLKIALDQVGDGAVDLVPADGDDSPAADEDVA
jgi:hypothetical protein